jgi:uncharacterized protein (TIGR02145 family)
MKKLQSTFTIFLLCAFTFTFFNCTKDEESAPPLNWEGSTFTDSRDSKIYKTIKIGNQEWLAENLAFKTSSGSWNYGNLEENGTKYGRIYTWEAAKQAVPSGWHLPTDTEWKQLEMFLGMSQAEADHDDYRGTDEGGKLKNTTGWAENGNGTNEIGFAALPGGFRSNTGNFMVREWYGYWWTETEFDSLNAWFRLIVSTSSKIQRSTSYKGEAYSVRCVKN